MDDRCIDPALHSMQAVPKRKRCHSVKRGARRLHPILWQRQIQDLKEYLSENLGIELPSGIQRKHPQSPPETGELQIILQKNAQQWSITILSTEHYRQCLEVSTNPITPPHLPLLWLLHRSTHISRQVSSAKPAAQNCRPLGGSITAVSDEHKSKQHAMDSEHSLCTKHWSWSNRVDTPAVFSYDLTVATPMQNTGRQTQKRPLVSENLDNC